MTALVENELPSQPKPSINGIHSAVLIAALTCGLCLTAWSVAGFAGLAVMLLCASAILIFEPKIPGLSLIELYKGKKQANDTSQVSSVIEVLAYRAGLPQRPDLYVIPSLTLSAFSTGTPEKPAIAVTEGLLRRLTLRETAGILAHEMVHIRNGDISVFKLADALARLTPLMALTGVALAGANLVAVTLGEQVAPWIAVAFLYVAPALSSALQLSLSRAREDEADAQAILLTGDAMGLASALQRMESSMGTPWDDFRIPIAGRRIPYPALLRSHAPDKVRIARLLTTRAGSQQRPAFEPLVIVEQPMVSLVGYGPGEMRPRTRWNGLWF
ncbi:MAG: zinc metalloprotease HtpX [Hyphomicrobium sp.]